MAPFDTSRLRISPGLAEQAIASPRFDLLGTIGTDISTIGTWDDRLSRRTRILVPVDVQAYVVPDGGLEETVDVGGDPATEQRPFAAGAPKPPGVHLHWAMPDALLAGGHDESTRSPVMPSLPDQWVVVRTLQPVGLRQVVATGWVVDARSQVVTPLPAFTGAATALPDGAAATLDGLSGGPGWTASYAGAAGRLTFHDPLTDLDALTETAPDGFAGRQAAYTVAGWWSDIAADPLSEARGSAGLDAVLSSLRWRVEHDADDRALEPVDPRTIRLMRESGLGVPAQTASTRILGGDGRRIGGALDGLELDVAYPIAEVDRVWHGEALPKYHALLHGSVLGVPIEGELPAADDRPAPDGLSVSLGSDLDDVVAALGATGMGLDTEQRRAAEDLLAAFNNGLTTELGTTDGLDTLGQREHENGFWSLPGAPLPAARADRLRREDTLAANPLSVGRKGRAAAVAGAPGETPSTLGWRAKVTLQEQTGRARPTNPRVSDVAPAKRPAPEAREVSRPAPRYYRPAPLMMAVQGARPSQRHHGDGLYDDSGRLLCRYPATAVPRIEGLLDGTAVLPTLGSGAIPEEVTTVVREAVLLNPYGLEWLVGASAPAQGMRAAVTARLLAEMVRLYGADGTYDGTSHVAFAQPKAAAASTWGAVSSERSDLERKVSAELSRFSTLPGLPPSPVAITTWRQPWVPLWVEWRVTLTGTTTARGWRLDGYDLEPDDGPTPPTYTTTLEGRSHLGQGVDETIRAAITSWLGSENQRQITRQRSSFGDGAVVQRLADLNHPLDLVSASLDGIREQLLGIDYVGQILRASANPSASGAATVLFGGRLRLDAVRLVDAFGRTVSVPEAVLDLTRSTLELEVAEEPRTLTLRPRIQNAARWLWRLVDPGQPAGTPFEELNEAYVDQVDPTLAVNPVAGFLLPDHIDEAVEAFEVAGRPIGQVGHDPISGAVTWEPAPGRAVPPDAGPLVDLDAHARIVGEIAAGMVRADAAARSSQAPPEASALVTFLRAVDTTLWSIDTFAGLGSGTLAGLVGRPLAVVRGTLRLDAPDDLAEVDLPDAEAARVRAAAFAALDEERFEVHLGTLGRADDTLLGFYVDDDYETLHLVDKVVAEQARKTGRQTGHLGLLGETGPVEVEALDHPYLSAEDTLFLRRGQTVMLTMLMLPGGRVHLTSGILPRKEIALADSWFTPGLKHLVPSVRVGPLLVDPAEVRLPLVSVLGERQTFTRRTGELSWQDDPILAATQTAYLPRLPHVVQEGWIRVTPPEDQEPT